MGLTYIEDMPFKVRCLLEVEQEVTCPHCGKEFVATVEIEQSDLAQDTYGD